MPTRKDGGRETEVVKVRIGCDLLRRASHARVSGAHAGDAESTFLGYLVAIGLAKYEKSILPLEAGEEVAPDKVGRQPAAGE